MKKFLSTTKVNSRRSSGTRQWYLIFLCGVGALGLFYIVPHILFSIAAAFMFPIHYAADWFENSSTALPAYVRDRAALVDELERKEQVIAEVSVLGEEVQYLREENERLRTLLGADQKQKIVAGIIARPNQLPHDVLLLDKGAEDGVEVNAPVYMGEATVIGYVQTVRAKNSVITLVSSPGFRSTVYVFGPDIYTTAEGMGSGLLRVGVPQGITLNEGDSVVLPAVSNGLYGAIRYIETSPTQPEQFGYVVAPAALSSLHYVTIGRSPLQTQSFAAARENVEAAYLEYFTVAVPEEELVSISTTTASSTEVLPQVEIDDTTSTSTIEQE